MEPTQKSPPLTLTSVVARSADQISAEVDGETLLMSIERGKYYGMDAVGSRIWALLEQPRSIGEICDALMASFEVEREHCQRDVIAFVRDLLEQNLATLADESH